MNIWALLLDLLGCLNEEFCVIVVLIHTRGDREDVQIKDDVLRCEVDSLKKVVCSHTDVNFVLELGGLACLIEGHDDDSGAILLDESCLCHEVFFTLFQRDTVDYTLALALL